MAEFEVVFYEKENASRPVEDFLNSLDEKMQAKMIGLFDVLEEMGNQLREPYSKKDCINQWLCQKDSKNTA